MTSWTFGNSACDIGPGGFAHLARGWLLTVGGNSRLKHWIHRRKRRGPIDYQSEKGGGAWLVKTSIFNMHIFLAVFQEGSWNSFPGTYLIIRVGSQLLLSANGMLSRLEFWPWPCINSCSVGPGLSLTSTEIGGVGAWVPYAS